MQEEKLKYLIRVCNTDLEGKKPIHHALTKIKGVGKMYAQSVCVVAQINPFTKAGSLSDADVLKLNDIVKHPLRYHIPRWMLNRRHDPITGEDGHLLTSDLDFQKGNDIKLMQKIKCYKGARHALGLPVRGQRTRSNFRKNKGKVTGVMKKKVMAASAPADKGKEKK